VRPKVSWADLICRTHQYYRRQWPAKHRVVKFQEMMMMMNLPISVCT